MQVRVVDGADRPLPRAVVWELPGEAWQRRNWIPGECLPWYCNPHELLRHLGTRRVADAAGRVLVQKGAVLAGEHAGLAGVAFDATTAGGSPLVLDDSQWTIFVRDESGRAVLGVPVACAPAPQAEFESDPFEGMSLGLTDNDGRLFVRAPDSVRVPTYQLHVAGPPAPPPPPFIRFEVEGMHLAAHTQKLPWEQRFKATIHLTMPPTTKVEVRAPEWCGPIEDAVWFTCLERVMEWDGTNGWWEADKHFALVGAPSPGHTQPIVVQISGTRVLTVAEVPALAPGETFPIQMELEPTDAVVRARVLDAKGNPASFAVFRVTHASDQVRNPFVRADRKGRVALIVRPPLGDAAELQLEVEAGPDPRLFRRRAHLRVEDLQAGGGLDAGTITLALPQ